MKDLVLDAVTQPSLDLSFDIGITVLSFVDLGATLSMEENGDDLFVDFILVADAELVETTVKGDAKLDLVRIEDTDFGSFDVSVAWGGAAKEIGEFVDAAVGQIKDEIEGTIQAVGDAIQDIGNAIKGLIASIPFIAEVFNAAAELGKTTTGNFIEGIDKLFNSGDPTALAEAAITLANDFDKTFEENEWEELGNQVAAQAGNLGLKILEGVGLTTNSVDSEVVELSEKDKWGCNYKRVDTTTQRCWGVTIEIGICPACVDERIEECDPPKTKRGPKFQDPVCVSKKQKLLEDTRKALVTAGTIGTGSKVTTSGNTALLLEGRDNLPNASFDDITGSVPYSKDCSSILLQSKISGYTKILDNKAPRGISDSDTAFQTDDMVNLDFTPSCENATGSSTSQAYSDSVRAGINALKQQVNQTVNKDMTGIDPSIKAYQPEVQLIPLTIGFTNPIDKELEITCSMLKETNKQKPQILTFDPDCKTTLTYETIKETFDVPSKYPCGTVELTRRWTVSDTCGQSAYVDQFIYQQPQAPIWTENPWSEPVSDVNSYHEMYDLDLSTHLRLSFRSTPFQPQLKLLALQLAIVGQLLRVSAAFL